MEFSAIYAHALRGELRQALSVLDTLDPVGLSDKERAAAAEYRRRFASSSDLLAELEAEDSFVRRLVLTYRTYWRDVMLDRVSPTDGEARVLAELHDLLGVAAHAGSTGEQLEALEPQLQETLQAKGYFSLLGVTRPFRELMLWKDQERTTYSVELPECDSEPVAVVLMDRFLSLGWAHFATLGERYTGGWAKPDALYCVRQAYDLESEAFRVSYLVHEGQHAADNRSYPHLDQGELEYRAKLAELCFADASLTKVLGHFLASHNRDRVNPHAFAEYWLVANLGGELFGDTEPELREWSKVEPARLRAAARRVLKRSTDELVAAGANEVKQILPN